MGGAERPFNFNWLLKQGAHHRQPTHLLHDIDAARALRPNRPRYPGGEQPTPITPVLCRGCVLLVCAARGPYYNMHPLANQRSASLNARAAINIARSARGGWQVSSWCDRHGRAERGAPKRKPCGCSSQCLHRPMFSQPLNAHPLLDFVPFPFLHPIYAILICGMSQASYRGKYRAELDLTGEGGYVVCRDPVGWAQPGCIVLSFGVEVR